MCVNFGTVKSKTITLLFLTLSHSGIRIFNDEYKVGGR